VEVEEPKLFCLIFGGMAAAAASWGSGDGIHGPVWAAGVVWAGSPFPVAPDAPAQNTGAPGAEAGFWRCPPAGGPMGKRRPGGEFYSRRRTTGMAVADAVAACNCGGSS
jgi:hypothetical protein